MLKRLAILSVLVGFTMTSHAVISPYIGTEYKKEWLPTHKYWSDVLSDSYTGGSIFIGTKFVDFLAVELGYDWTGQASKDHSFGTVGSFFGLSAVNVSSNSKTKFTGWHTDCHLLFPIFPKMKLIGSAGIAVVKPNLTITSPETAGTTVDAALNSVRANSEPVSRLGLGVSFNLHKWTIRALWRWQDTSALRVSGDATFNSLSDAKKAFKSGHSLNLGVSFDF